MDSELTVKRRLAPALPPEFYARLIAFYRRQPTEGEHFSKLWQFVIDGFQKPLLKALETGEGAPLADVLGHLYSNKVMYGLDSSLEGMDEYDLGLGKPEHLTEDFFRAGCLRLLHTAAVSFGAVPLFNPEQEKEDAPDSDADLAAVEAALGCPLDHPGAGNVSGLCYGSRFIPHKLLDAACLVASLLRLSRWRFRCVLEVGAGAGWLIYLANRMGLRCLHTIDLPLVSVIQAYMLATAIAPNKIWLAGEVSSSAEVFVHGLNPDITVSWFDLIVNQNSFPEMSPEQQQHYIKLFEKVLHCGGYFYSVNHEAAINGQSRTFNALAKSPAFRQIQRSPYWARAGYVEEVWQYL